MAKITVSNVEMGQEPDKKCIKWKDNTLKIIYDQSDLQLYQNLGILLYDRMFSMVDETSKTVV